LREEEGTIYLDKMGWRQPLDLIRQPASSWCVGLQNSEGTAACGHEFSRVRGPLFAGP
jgi:hypothetical protein